MKGPTYVLNNAGVHRYHRYTMSLHQTKLKSIKDRKVFLASISPSPSFNSHKKFIEERKNYIEKRVEIHKENKLLFTKLLNISQQSSSIIKHPKVKKNANLKSSYEIFRKNRDRQIAVENEQIVKKLIEIKPFLVKKTLDQEYFEYQKTKKRLSRLSPIEASRSFESKPSKQPLE